jgi:hypothetical protein
MRNSLIDSIWNEWEQQNVSIMNHAYIMWEHNPLTDPNQCHCGFHSLPALSLHIYSTVAVCQYASCTVFTYIVFPPKCVTGSWTVFGGPRWEERECATCKVSVVVLCHDVMSLAVYCTVVKIHNYHSSELNHHDQTGNTMSARTGL